LGNLSRLIFALTVGITKIVCRMAPLVGKRAGLGIAQQVCEIGESRLDISTVSSAMRKYHQVLVEYPLITDNGY
jgi:hypothetical protein